jgi:hypothetical protein
MCIIRRGLFFLVILACIVLIKPKPALACSCLAPPSASAALAGSTAVFAGRVVRLELSNEPDGFNSQVKVTIEAAQVWKGAAQIRPVVQTDISGAGCGYDFRLGEEYLVYAHGQDSRLYVSLCSLTKPLANATLDLQALGNGQRVLAEGVNFTIPVIVIGIVLLSLIIVITILRRSARYHV